MVSRMLTKHKKKWYSLGWGSNAGKAKVQKIHGSWRHSSKHIHNHSTRCKWLPSCSGCFTPRKRKSSRHSIRRWMAPELAWMMWRREKPLPMLGNKHLFTTQPPNSVVTTLTNTGSPVIQLIVWSLHWQHLISHSAHSVATTLMNPSLPITEPTVRQLHFTSHPAHSVVTTRRNWAHQLASPLSSHWTQLQVHQPIVYSVQTNPSSPAVQSASSHYTDKPIPLKQLERAVYPHLVMED